MRDLPSEAFYSLKCKSQKILIKSSAWAYAVKSEFVNAAVITEYSVTIECEFAKKINIFVKALKEQGRAITEFDDALWCSMVDFVTIGRDYRSVTFKDGTEIKV